MTMCLRAGACGRIPRNWENFEVRAWFGEQGTMSSWVPWWRINTNLMSWTPLTVTVMTALGGHRHGMATRSVNQASRTEDTTEGHGDGRGGLYGRNRRLVCSFGDNPEVWLMTEPPPKAKRWRTTSCGMLSPSSLPLRLVSLPLVGRGRLGGFFDVVVLVALGRVSSRLADTCESR